MLMKVIILLLLLAVVYSLGSALFYMLSDKKSSTAMAKALTWRITLSLVIFFLLLLGYLLGWFVPHGVMPPA